MTVNPFPAVRALVESLRDDPFYRTLCVGASSDSERDQMLERYFDYSMSEGVSLGRCLVRLDDTPAAAIWLLPASEQKLEQARQAKDRFVREALGPKGADNYRQMIEFMSPRSRVVVPASAWYLSIVGVSRAGQGKGVGAQLLRETLAEADQLNAPCYLETYTSH